VDLIGRKAVVKVDRRRQAQSYIGFLDQDDGRCVLERLAWQSGEEILAALQRLAGRHPGKRICVVWDNASWHKTRIIRDQLAEGGALQNVHLVAFPPTNFGHSGVRGGRGRPNITLAHPR
jgi:hypothetical protein